MAKVRLSSRASGGSGSRTASKLSIKKVTVAKLTRIATKAGSIRVGVTERDPKDRKAEYRRAGFRGTMFVAETRNMMTAEDRLIGRAKDSGRAIHNVHRLSNAPEAPGIVYTISGRKLS